MPQQGEQVRLFEVRKTKVKGEVEPVFDKIASKSVMTLLPKSGKVADVVAIDQARALRALAAAGSAHQNKLHG